MEKSENTGVFIVSIVAIVAVVGLVTLLLTFNRAPAEVVVPTQPAEMVYQEPVAEPTPEEMGIYQEPVAEPMPEEPSALDSISGERAGQALNLVTQMAPVTQVPATPTDTYHCVDPDYSDGTRGFFTPSTATLYFGSSVSATQHDKCSGNTLTEWNCGRNYYGAEILYPTTYDCGVGLCQVDRCICYDTDAITSGNAGLNYLTQGTVRSMSDPTQADFCNDEYRLVEYKCVIAASGSTVDVKSAQYDCRNMGKKCTVGKCA
ncbi:TPA: hypothetical protein HA265_06505 [Candidatus Woesearchaeota archaeon]|nr:hypothetical protein [Candidatus Woesearchaeota archaeon]